jgi:hypothetical protein
MYACMHVCMYALVDWFVDAFPESMLQTTPASPWTSLLQFCSPGLHLSSKQSSGTGGRLSTTWSSTGWHVDGVDAVDGVYDAMFETSSEEEVKQAWLTDRIKRATRAGNGYRRNSFELFTGISAHRKLSTSSLTDEYGSLDLSPRKRNSVGPSSRGTTPVPFAQQSAMAAAVGDDLSDLGTVDDGLDGSDDASTSRGSGSRGGSGSGSDDALDHVDMHLRRRYGISRPSTVVSVAEADSDDEAFVNNSDSEEDEIPFASDEEVCTLPCPAERASASCCAVFAAVSVCPCVCARDRLG